MAKSGGGAGRGGSGSPNSTSGGGYTNGTERQQRFADSLKKDAVASINADTKQLLKRSSDAATTAKIEAFRKALIDKVMGDRDAIGVINRLDMKAWRIDLIAKAYNIKP